MSERRPEPAATWLRDVLWLDPEMVPWTRRGTGVERFVAVPDVVSARQLMPWRPATAVAATRRVSDDRAPLTRWRDGAATAGLLTVAACSGRRRLVVRSAESLIGRVSADLGVRRAFGLIMCGPPRANQKPVIQLHDGLGRTIAFVKVAWNDLTRELLAAERQALEVLSAVDDRGFSVPAVLASGTFGTSTWLAIAPAGVGHRERPDLASVDRLATAIERTAESWHGPTSESPFAARLQREAGGLGTGQRAFAALLAREADRPIALTASHGDYVPWNVLSGRPRPAVWDWERFDRAVPTGSDRIHYRFQVGVQRAHRGVVDVMASIAGELDAILADVDADRRDAHFDWYTVALLCRYERDAGMQPTPRLLSRVSDLTTVLTRRGVLT